MSKDIIAFPKTISSRVVSLVLGTAQAAWDLLEKRSDIYSSRPRFVVAYVSVADEQEA